MKLSIVSTLYRSASTVEEFCARVISTAEKITDDIEIILVNDGSPDDSLELALNLYRADSRIIVVDLVRNFGHHKAMMTGLAYAQGDLVFLIDCDLEEEPEVLGKFFETLGQENCDVVYGIQERRRGGLVERVTGAVFFTIVEALSDHKLPRNVVTARLMRRDYVRSLVRHRDREFLIAHLWELAGFKQIPLKITKLALSPTTYSLRRRLEMAIKHVTTTSTRLLYYILYTGILVCGLSVVTIAYFIVRYLLSGIGVGGWTSLIVSVWFFGGLTTLILGVLGIYIANILSETKRRPYTTVRRVHRAENERHVIKSVAALDSRQDTRVVQ
ncbi:glycosyltransferase family 2 protein [Microvirga roseola]|uniref:glycosyltransferase family 2 protein n=1 Tax=Microvirga roseola TaxID=2883126 RepID=UPI001E397864|nr:glycosyltransferase family 2 protein [Microvirga roseola]